MAQAEGDEFRIEAMAVLPISGLTVRAIIGFSEDLGKAFYPGTLAGSHPALQYGGSECLDTLSLTKPAFDDPSLEYSHNY